MSSPEKTNTSADKEEDEEDKRTNTDQAVTTTTTTTTVATPPTRRRRRRTLQVGTASGETKTSAVKGAGSSTSSKTGKPKRKIGELDAPKREPTCPLCGSRFGSWKGYFGHLRIHNERLWKGAFPPPIGTEMVDEQFQEEYIASELTRIGHETLHKMRHQESNSGASNASARNVSIDLNVEPEVDDEQTENFDLNLPPWRNDDDDDAPAP